MLVRLNYLYLAIFLTLFWVYPANAADETAPQLVDWVLTESQSDLIPNGASYSAKFIISSKINLATPVLWLQNANTSEKSPLALVNLKEKSGNLYVYTATVALPKDAAPRKWIWTFSPVQDSSGTFRPILITIPEKNLAVYALGDSYKVGDLANESFIEQAVRIYIGTQSLFDSYSARLTSALIKYPDDDGLLLAKLKEPNFPKNPPKNSALFDLAQEFAAAVQNYGDLVEAATARLYLAEKANTEKANTEKANTEKANIQSKTIKCTKGKITKKISGLNPKCPAGYKVKK